VGYRSQEFKVVVLTWTCDGDDGRCGDVFVLADPSAAQRMAGAPGWQRVQDGRTFCPEHKTA
jgi:hypothetical protein